MQESISVISSDASQQPTGTSGESGLQQTRSSESLGVSKAQTPAPQASQDQIMELLRTESAGPTHDTATTTPRDYHMVKQVGMVTAGVVVAAILLVVYYRLFSKLLNRPKQNT